MTTDKQMKFEFIGCCFRVEVELFRQRHLDLSRYAFARREKSFGLRRQLLRETIAKMKSTPAPIPAETELSRP